MAKKREMEGELKELRAKVQQNKVIIGRDEVLRGVQSGSVSKVFLARNCPEKIRQDLHHYASLAQVPVVDLEMDNEELGVFCKKNFFISVLASVGA